MLYCIMFRSARDNGGCIGGGTGAGGGGGEGGTGEGGRTGCVGEKVGIVEGVLTQQGPIQFGIFLLSVARLSFEHFT
jgi:hypothetical protein